MEEILKSVTGRALRKDSLEIRLGLDVVKELLQEYYVDKLMPPKDIAVLIKEKYGIKTSEDSVWKMAVRFGVQRTKAQAISLAKCQLDRSVILNDKLIGIIDGMLFGDGNIAVNVDTGVGRVQIGSCHEECAKYYSDLLKSYMCSEPHYNPGLKGVGMWSVKTLHHPDFYEQYLRWYPGGIKAIPADIEFTPEMVLLWYLGDGCLSSPIKGNARYMYFATNCFSKESLERIVVPKFAEIGIEVIRVTDDSRVFIQTNSINKLLQYMGVKSPVRCFDYKFEIEEWRTFKSMKQVAVEANIDYGRLSSWVKHGHIDHSRSPGGKKVVFSNEQFDSLVKRLDSGELPRTPGKRRIK